MTDVPPDLLTQVEVDALRLRQAARIQHIRISLLEMTAQLIARRTTSLAEAVADLLRRPS